MDFISTYLGYTEQSEPPTIFHRWAAVSAIGALLGRNFYIPFGHTKIVPNLYTMFIGEPGTRKSSAIKLMAKLIRASGYSTFASNKTTKEKFLLDLEGLTLDNPSNSDIVEMNLFGSGLGGGDNGEPKEVWIVADEFNEFAKGDKLDFWSFLGSLWDWDDDNVPFTDRLKNSKSVAIFQPTISILGGNTQDSFAKAFPPEIIGQGFMSRLLIVYGEPSGKKFTFPPPPDPLETSAIVDMLSNIKNIKWGQAEISEEANEVLDRIYKGWIDLDDVRFKFYNTRRFTQLLKLCLITAASWGSRRIELDTVVYSNTILSAAERNMPKALGEFGMSKNSDAANKVINILAGARKAFTGIELWEHLNRDLERVSQMHDILSGLVTAKKIQFVPGPHGGYLSKKAVTRDREFVDFGLLTAEERMML